MPDSLKYAKTNVLRINENLKIDKGNGIENLKKYVGKNTNFDAQIVSHEKSYHIEIKTKRINLVFNDASREVGRIKEI